MAGSAKAPGPQQRKQEKVIFKVESPFKDIVCPVLAEDYQSTVVKLLCELLQPLGDHRRSTTATKKALKRKHREVEDIDEGRADVLKQAQAVADDTKLPEMARWLLVGLNSVTRQLEAEIPLSQGKARSPRLAIVLVTGSQESMVYSHLPVMCALASASCAAEQGIRLIYLDADADAHSQLGLALGLPRVGVIGIIESDVYEVPAAVKDMIAFCRSNLSPIKSSLLDQSAAGSYRPVKIV